jgi:sulfatase maturation enzyme AslB (radical SAM superfamily)
MKRARQHMSDEVFFKVLREFILPLRDDFYTKGHPPTLILHKDGEPLLHPKLLTFITAIAACRPDVKMDIYTNGLLLTEDFVDTLRRIWSKFRILVSFHFYSHTGKQIDYSGIDPILERIAKKKHPNIEVIFASHVTRFCSETELSEWKEGWLKRLWADFPIHVNKHINPWTGLIDEENCVSFNGCPYADGNHLFIGVTGNILACCMDLEERLSFGNVLTDRPHTIFDRVNIFYEDIKEKAIIPDLCKKCMEG